MKKAILSLIFVFPFVLANAQSKQQIIANETAFAKLYGYVKYFYPGDEAASINWDNFAIYGAKKVARCANTQALKQTLHSLFDPIVPTLQLIDSADNVTFNKQSIIPPSINGYKTIAWQHVGGRARPANYEGDPFRSARTNRPIYFDEMNQNIGVFPKVLDAKAYKNKEFIFRGRAKIANGNGAGHFLALVLTPGDKWGFFDNMLNNPVVTTEWTDFEIKGKIDTNAQYLRAGLFLSGAGELWVDDLTVAVMENGKWKDLYVNNFNDEKPGIATREILRGTRGGNSKEDRKITIIEDAKKTSEKWLSVKSLHNSIKKKHSTLFKDYPEVGEYITKDIGSGLKIVMPIALYGMEGNTYPMADAGKFDELKNVLNAVALPVNTADSLAIRFANIIITWNQLQHFFPYFDVAKTDWLGDLRNALADAFDDTNGYDFLKTLQKFTAKLKDEHIRVFWANDQNAFFPAITWEWIENKLVVTKVLDNTLALTKGDIITAIDNQAPEAYYKNIEQYIAAATPGGLKDRAQTESLLGSKETSLKLSFLRRDNTVGQISLARSLAYRDYSKAVNLPDSVKQIDPDIMYLNITTVNIKPLISCCRNCKKARLLYVICGTLRQIIGQPTILLNTC